MGFLGNGAECSGGLHGVTGLHGVMWAALSAERSATPRRLLAGRGETIRIPARRMAAGGHRKPVTLRQVLCVGATAATVDIPCAGVPIASRMAALFSRRTPSNWRGMPAAGSQDPHTSESPLKPLHGDFGVSTSSRSNGTPGSGFSLPCVGITIAAWGKAFLVHSCAGRHCY